MLPASDASAPFGMRIATDGMCSNESGIESSRTFMGKLLIVDAVEHRLADVFLKLQARRECESPRERVRLRQCLRIVDRELDVHVAEIGPAIPFREMHLIAVRLARRVEPGLVVEANGVDDHRVAVPSGRGQTGPAL